MSRAAAIGATVLTLVLAIVGYVLLTRLPEPKTGGGETSVVTGAASPPRSYNCDGTLFTLDSLQPMENNTTYQSVSGTPYSLLMVTLTTVPADGHFRFALFRLDQRQMPIWCRLFHDDDTHRGTGQARAAIGTANGIIVPIDYGARCVYELRYRARDGVLIGNKVFAREDLNRYQPIGCEPDDPQVLPFIREATARQPTWLRRSVEQQPLPESDLPAELSLTCLGAGTQACDALTSSAAAYELDMLVRGISLGRFKSFLESGYRFRLIDNFGQVVAVRPDPYTGYMTPTSSVLADAAVRGRILRFSRPGRVKPYGGGTARVGRWVIRFQMLYRGRVQRSARFVTRIACDGYESEIRNIKCAR